MATIFMRVLNQPRALETLLYVFKNQMKWGKKHLTFTLKHSDGYKEWCKGSIDEVFKHQIMKDIEYGDLILLEHHDSFVHSYVHFNDKVELNVLSELALSMSRGAHFIVPRGNGMVYFVIKEYPMSHYALDKNEIISDEVVGNTSYILNNMCGKIDHLRGIYATLTLK